MNRTYSKQIPVTQIGPYTVNVPFNLGVYVTEHTLTANDEFVPVIEANVPEPYKPIPGYGAFYRIIGEGTFIPTFDASFKKSSASGDFDETLGVLNLITFLFDGFDYWYSIVQAV